MSWEDNEALVRAVQKQDTNEIRRLVENYKIPATPPPGIRHLAMDSPISVVRPNKKGREILMYLLKHGANINDKSFEGKTPLHAWASSPTAEEDVPELLKLGANVNAQDYEGNTPLHDAVFNSSVGLFYALDSIPILINNGADVTIKNREGQTALELAESVRIKDAANIIKQVVEENREKLKKGLYETRGVPESVTSKILQMANKGGRRKTKRNFAKRSNARTRQRRLRSK